MRALTAVALTALAVTACATNPATGRRQLMIMSEQEEIQLGKQSDAEVRKQMGAYRDAELQRYVDRVGQRLARASHRPALPWTFTVVDSSAVNAFALPGGYIYITRGILPFLRDEAELAAVLGHEVGHVDARHSASAYSKQVLTGVSLAAFGVFVPSTRPFQEAFGVALGLMFLKNSREAELEADRLGVGYASAQGWEPDGMTGLLGTLARLDEAGGSSRGVPNWALTHPPAEDRVAKVESAIIVARAAGGTARNRATFEPHLDGLVFGDSREQGIVRGSEFLHPILGFALRFPAGWEVANTDQQVSAQEKAGGSVAVVLEAVENPSGSVEQVARADMTRSGFQESSGQRTTINGLNAYIGTYEGTIRTTRVTVRAAHIQVDRQVYLVAGIAPSADFSRVDQVFTATIRSFRAMSRDEAARVQPNRVDFRIAGNGETWESLARSAANANIKASTLAIMNGSSPATPPRPGDRIRIVVGG